MDKAEKCLERRNNKRKIYYRTEIGYNLVNQAQEMITRERCVVLDEKQILIPGCEIWFTDGEVIDAFATKENETYYMFINKAIIEEQKEYLEKLNWKFLIDSGIKEEYIDSLIEYGLYFVIFHESLIFYVDMSKLIWKIMRIRKQKSVKQTCFPWIILLIFCFIQKNQLNGVRRLKNYF